MASPMCRLSRPARTALLAALLVATAARGADRGVPDLVFEGPPAFDPLIADLRWIRGPGVASIAAWLELPEAGGPLRVVLAPEDTAVARTTPRWIAGFARGETNTAVLFPARVVRYPYDDLAGLFLHEVTHLLAYRAAGGHETPRWFAEGVALHAARGFSFADRRHALAAGLGGGPETLDELADAFGGGSSAVAQAYSLSGFLVDELIDGEGPGVVAAILTSMRAGRTFDAAFREVTGRGVDAWAGGVWRRYRIWYRWVPFVTSGATLWILVTALALVAIVRRRQRDAAIRDRWEAQEARVPSPPTLRLVADERDDDGEEPPEEPREWIH